jgi:hypothetical protein
MNILESAPGQQSPNLADVLHRNLLPDGRVILQALHNEGMLKKIQTNQVIVTPTAQSNVKLDELNRIVKEMESGADALKRMQQLDASAGIVDPATKRKAEKAFKEGRIAEAEAWLHPWRHLLVVHWMTNHLQPTCWPRPNAWKQMPRAWLPKQLE